MNATSMDELSPEALTTTTMVTENEMKENTEIPSYAQDVAQEPRQNTLAQEAVSYNGLSGDCMASQDFEKWLQSMSASEIKNTGASMNDNAQLSALVEEGSSEDLHQSQPQLQEIEKDALEGEEEKDNLADEDNQERPNLLSVGDQMSSRRFESWLMQNQDRFTETNNNVAAANNQLSTLSEEAEEYLIQEEENSYRPAKRRSSLPTTNAERQSISGSGLILLDPSYFPQDDFDDCEGGGLAVGDDLAFQSVTSISREPDMGGSSAAIGDDLVLGNVTTIQRSQPPPPQESPASVYSSASAPGAFHAMGRPIGATASPGAFHATGRPIGATASPGAVHATGRPIGAAASPGAFHATGRPIGATASHGAFHATGRPLGATTQPPPARSGSDSSTTTRPTNVASRAVSDTVAVHRSDALTSVGVDVPPPPPTATPAGHNACTSRPGPSRRTGPPPVSTTGSGRPGLLVNNRMSSRTFDAWLLQQQEKQQQQQQQVERGNVTSRPTASASGPIAASPRNQTTTTPTTRERRSNNPRRRPLLRRNSTGSVLPAALRPSPGDIGHKEFGDSRRHVNDNGAPTSQHKGGAKALLNAPTKILKGVGAGGTKLIRTVAPVKLGSGLAKAPNMLMNGTKKIFSSPSSGGGNNTNNRARSPRRGDASD